MSDVTHKPSSVVTEGELQYALVSLSNSECILVFMTTNQTTLWRQAQTKLLF